MILPDQGEGGVVFQEQLLSEKQSMGWNTRLQGVIPSLLGAASFLLLCLANPSLAEHGQERTHGDSLSKNQFLECDENEVIKKIKCADEDCDRKQIVCEVYTHGDDTTAKIFRLTETSSKQHFLHGIHDDDETFSLQYLSSTILNNTGECGWEKLKRKSQGDELKCKDDRFASGFACEDDDCDVLKLYCCKSKPVNGSDSRSGESN